MIDIETVNNTMTSAILSIAAVPWNPDSGRYDKKDYFYRVIDLQSCFNLGLTAGGKTLEWWFQQSTEARMNAFGYDKNFEKMHPKIHIKEALQQLRTYIKDYPLENKRFKIWGNGARFDLGILDNAFTAAKVPLPWGYRNERDVRTLVSLRPELKNKVSSTGIAHNAVDDCVYQIKYCSKIWKKLNDSKFKKTEKTKTTSRKKIDS